MLFRGTYNELKAQKMKIQIWNHHLLGKVLIGSKTVLLKHYLSSNFLKAEMVIHKRKKLTEENLR